jgi:lipid-binding SYLF domain-containing protein
MSLSMLYGETTLPISISTSTYETSTGFDISTFTAMIFMLKSSQTLDDVDAEYSITDGADLTYSSNVLTAKINDWSGLSVGVPYYIGIGFKIGADTVYREIPLTTASQTIIFTQDTIRG